MNLATFLDHWKLTENPFRAEEARQDPVFLRLEDASAAADAERSRSDSDGAQDSGSSAAQAHANHAPHLSPTTHSEFEKIAGDFDHPSTAIIFGEKGSGKTAIRMQLADRIAFFNKGKTRDRCFLITYDDLNPILGRFVERIGNERKVPLTETLGKFRLVDHIDAVLASVVPGIVDRVLGQRADEPGRPDLGEDPRRVARKLDKSLRTDLLLLQAVYDRPVGAGAGGGAERRTRRLRRVLRLRLSIWYLFWTVLAFSGWIGPAALAYYAYTRGMLTLDPTQLTHIDSVVWVIAGLLALYLLILIKRSVWDRVKFITLGHRVRKQLRTSTRSDASFGRSLRQLDRALVDPGAVPMSSSDEVRYAMLDRLRRVLNAFGYASAVIIIDRVDEPTLISGDPDRMRAVIWPLLNNKFLQQPWLGVKMLLPMELRHALFRESAAFFQEARLDKQNLIERLSWTGQMLYDLCNARLQACRVPEKQPLALLDMFAEDVTRQDLIEALDQMHQPRDAFKLIYQCFTEHCSSQTSDQPAFRVPRLILDLVRKAQVERVRQLYRGVRPA